MIQWKVSHKHKLDDHIERKEIGIYSSAEKAEEAINLLKQKNGFRDTADGFEIKRVFKFFKPPYLDNTYWIDGFDKYTY